MSELFNLLVAVVVVSAVSVGVLMLFPQTSRSLVPATGAILLLFLVLTIVGSALVGPVDLRAMLFIVPVVSVVVTAWYFSKLKSKVAS